MPSRRSHATSGDFTQAVPLAPGESFTFATTTSERTSEYHVRCLPGDFPDWTYDRPGDPSAAFYITTPQNVATPSDELASTYVAIFDDHGVPVWWRQADGATDAKLLARRHARLGHHRARRHRVQPRAGAGFQTHELDGSAGRHLEHRRHARPTSTTSSCSRTATRLIGAYPARPGTTRPHGRTAVRARTARSSTGWSRRSPPMERWPGRGARRTTSTPVRDARAVAARVRLRAAARARRTVGGLRLGPSELDPADRRHGRSLSFRHLDAVYLINKDDGEIIWKLGGTPTPKSLTVVGDPEANPLGGQHFARLLADGTVTVYDNNS